MRFLKLTGAILTLLLILAAAWIAKLYYIRPGLDAYAAHHLTASPPDDGSPALTATWFGTTAVLLSDGENAVFVDPFFTRPEGWLSMLTNRQIAPDEALIGRWIERARVGRLQAVLVSHSHYDHAMDAGIVAKVTRGQLVGSHSTANIGRGAGLAATQIRVATPGVAMSYGPFAITFLEGRHAGATGGVPTGDIVEPLVPPARYHDYRQGGTFSILIEHPLGTVLHHGSAGFLPGALRDRRADVVLLGIALRPDLDTYLAEVVDAVGARRVIPTHWDDFARSLDRPLLPAPAAVDLDGFFAEMARQRPDIEVQTLRMGEPVALFRSPQ